MPGPSLADLQGSEGDVPGPSLLAIAGGTLNTGGADTGLSLPGVVSQIQSTEETADAFAALYDYLQEHVVTPLAAIDTRQGDVAGALAALAEALAALRSEGVPSLAALVAQGKGIVDALAAQGNVVAGHTSALADLAVAAQAVLDGEVSLASDVAEALEIIAASAGQLGTVLTKLDDLAAAVGLLAKPGDAMTLTPDARAAVCLALQADGTALAALLQRTTAAVSVHGRVSTEGHIHLHQGDAYGLPPVQGFEIASPHWPDLTGQVVTFVCGSLEKSVEVVGAGTVRWALTSAETRQCTAGTFALRLDLGDGNVHSFHRGGVRLV